jgi:signal transduction histidine kinase
VVNLVVNAIQAMPEGGTVTLRTCRHEDAVCLEVEDTGCGIPEAIRDRLFLPFFTTKDADRGTGLGLAVVHGIVTAHGGTIEVSSVVGQGSRFRVVLPVAEDED